MLRIAIVDDNLVFLRIIHSIILKSKLESSFDIDLFTSGEQFISSGMEYNLVLLDIDMPKMNGIEVVDKITNSSTIIIYITGHSEYMERAFNINVFRFLKKDEIHVKLPEVLNQVIKKIEFKQDVLWKTPDGILGFEFYNIVYFEITNRKCFCYTYQKKYELINKNLSEILETLDDWFIQINRYQIINVRFITSYKENHFVTSYRDNEIFQISRNRKKIALEKYTERMLRDD